MVWKYKWYPFSYLKEMDEAREEGLKITDSDLIKGLISACDLNILSARRVLSEWREIPKQKALEEAERLKKEKALKEAEASLKAISGTEAENRDVNDIMYCIDYEPPLEVQGQLEGIVGSTMKIFRDTNGKDYSVDCLKTWTELTELQQAQIEQVDKIKRVTGKAKSPKLITERKEYCEKN